MEYYKIKIEDKHIVRYTQIMEIEAVEVGNTGYFICKTYTGVINDLVMQPFNRITREEAQEFVRNSKPLPPE